MVSEKGGEPAAGAAASAQIGEDEAALYDRQIRLWGLEAQNRLRNASVLIAGVGGLGAEVAKNLALAGLKQLTLMDHTKVDAATRHSQFLAPADSVGRNVAVASLDRCQQLNAMVKMNAVEADVADIADDDLKKYDLVCLCGDYEESTVADIDQRCRGAGVRFACGRVFGWIGYAFSDFGEQFEFVETSTNAEGGGGGGRSKGGTGSDVELDAGADAQSAIELDGPAEKRRKVEERHRLFMQQEVHTKKTLRFPSYKEAFRKTWSSKVDAAQCRKTVPPAFHAIKALARYKAAFGKLPAGDDDDADIVGGMWQDGLDQCHMAAKDVALGPAHFVKYCRGELSPVCAVVGGILAQEIIKAVSQRDKPLENAFFYDGTGATSGRVCRLPPAIL